MRCGVPSWRWAEEGQQRGCVSLHADHAASACRRRKASGAPPLLVQLEVARRLGPASGLAALNQLAFTLQRLSSPDPARTSGWSRAGALQPPDAQQLEPRTETCGISVGGLSLIASSYCQPGDVTLPVPAAAAAPGAGG